MKEKPAEKSKEKKVVKPVRKVQKVAQLSSSECKTGWFSQYQAQNYILVKCRLFRNKCSYYLTHTKI